MPVNPQAAAAELVRRGRLSPAEADARAPGWRLNVGGMPKLEAQDRKTLAEARKTAEGAGAAMIDLDRFQALNRQQGSGGFLGLPVIRDLHGMIDPEVGEMNAITNRLTPREREAGSGAMSDRDVEMYRSAVPGQGQLGPANAKIAGRRRAGAIREREYSAFMDYFARTNGTLNGAQELWDEYKVAEPIYDPQTGTVRQSRGWRDYFGIPAAPAGRVGTRAAGGTGSTRRPAAPKSPDKMSDDEIRRDLGL